MEANKKVRLNMLSILISILFFHDAGGITVKWGTNDGPIVPPTPAPPSPPPQKPYKVPAAVWEDLSHDIPNPNPYKPPVPDNIYFRPHLHPVGSTVHTAVNPQIQPYHHTRYTNVVYRPKSTEQPASTTLAPAKAFVNAYRPTTTAPTPSSTQRTVEITPRNEYNQPQERRYQTIENSLNKGFSHYNQVPQLALNYNPGFGFKYVSEDKDPRKYFNIYNNNYDKSDDKYNAIETNDIYADRPHKNDLDLSYEKHVAQRTKKSPTQFYVPQQPVNHYYNAPQLFFPAGFIRH